MVLCEKQEPCLFQTPNLDEAFISQAMLLQDAKRLLAQFVIAQADGAESRFEDMFSI
ncbi:hypothetical protein QD460_06390 [Rhizobium jaguaris]|uniref:hypothetical protein n=1 Tax=Rhizobium jaguaris TaxID=1312183 RepID=UPI0039BF9D4B